jgi:hypothetical protein
MNCNSEFTSPISKTINVHTISKIVIIHTPPLGLRQNPILLGIEIVKLDDLITMKDPYETISLHCNNSSW